MERANLSLCMITKNEQDTIADAIGSVRGVVSQIIVADTGSTDKTVDIARTLGAQVFSHEWRDDFSSARNFSIAQATSDWIMFIDADEVISPVDTAKIPHLCENYNLTGYIFSQRNYTDDHKRQNFVYCENRYPTYEKAVGYVPVNRIALFRNFIGIRFDGIVHETVSDSIKKINGVVGQTDIVIHHYGHIQPKRAEKISYYLKLGMKEIEKNPDSPKPYYDVGIILMNDGDLIEAEKHFKKTIEIDKNYQNVYYTMAILYMRWLKFDEALRYLDLADKEDRLPAQNLLTRGVIYDCVRNFIEAEKTFKLGAEIYSDNLSFSENLGFIYLKTSRPKEAHKIFDRLTNLCPTKSSFVLGKIQADYMMGKPNNTIKTLESWDKVGVYDKNIALWGLKIFAGLKLFDQLKIRLDLIEKVDGACAETSFYRGVYHQGIGDAIRAISFYKEAVKKNPCIADQVREKINLIGASL